MAEPGRATLRLYDVSGRLVRVLLDGATSPAGLNSVIRDGRSDAGKPVSPGVYLCRFESERRAWTKRLVFLR